VRLNGTSDLPWEGIVPAIFEQFPEVQFYDYTKSAHRMRNFLTGKLSANYHLTFSRSEENDGQCAEILALGGSVAVVYGVQAFEHALSGRFHGPYADKLHINGDAHDLRFLDPRGHVVALKAKGRAKRDASGFVVR
jgi:hypothetical protein